MTVSVLTTSQDCVPALESVNKMTISSEEASIQVDDEVDGVYCPSLFFPMSPYATVFSPKLT